MIILARIPYKSKSIPDAIIFTYRTHNESTLQTHYYGRGRSFRKFSVFDFLESIYGNAYDQCVFVCYTTKDEINVSRSLNAWFMYDFSLSSRSLNFCLIFSVGFYKYSYASLSNLLSSWFRYEALKLVSFTTVIIVKGSRLFPIMFVNKLMKKTKFHPLDWLTAFLLCSGSIVYMKFKDLSHDEDGLDASLSGQGY